MIVCCTHRHWNILLFYCMSGQNKKNKYFFCPLYHCLPSHRDTEQVFKQTFPCLTTYKSVSVTCSSVSTVTVPHSAWDDGDSSLFMIIIIMLRSFMTTRNSTHLMLLLRVHLIVQCTQHFWRNKHTHKTTKSYGHLSKLILGMSRRAKWVDAWGAVDFLPLSAAACDLLRTISEAPGVWNAPTMATVNPGDDLL